MCVTMFVLVMRERERGWKGENSGRRRRQMVRNLAGSLLVLCVSDVCEREGSGREIEHWCEKENSGSWTE